MTGDMPRSVTVSDEKILETLDDGPDPIRTVPGMEEELPIGRDGLRNRLKKLESRGEAVSKEVGARSVVWWRDSQESS